MGNGIRNFTVKLNQENLESQMEGRNRDLKFGYLCQNVGFVLYNIEKNHFCFSFFGLTVRSSAGRRLLPLCASAPSC